MEFDGLLERRYRYFWCDDFEPERYDLDGPAPCVTGKVWMSDGCREGWWDFALLLPQPFPSREAIDWCSLLPAENVTRWMWFDESTRFIEIDPASAEPDLF